MGGHEHAAKGGGHHSADAHHGQGAHGHHGHHGHHGPHQPKSVINYYIPDAGHEIEPFKAPDWRIYKVENAPELVKAQNILAAKGLKDPWLR